MQKYKLFSIPPNFSRKKFIFTPLFNTYKQTTSIERLFSPILVKRQGIPFNAEKNHFYVKIKQKPRKMELQHTFARAHRNIILLISQRYAEELGIHRENKRHPKRTEQSSKQELTYINTKCHIFHLMYVKAQENNEFKGLKGLKNVKISIE